MIYDETDIIVKRLSNKLAQKHEMYTNTTVRQTGSIESGMKVGLPHETDYLLFVQPQYVSNFRCDDSFLSSLLYEDANILMKESKQELTSELQGCWYIYGVEKNHVEICLVMEYRSTKDNY